MTQGLEVYMGCANAKGVKVHTSKDRTRERPRTSRFNHMNFKHCLKIGLPISVPLQDHS